MPVYNGARTVVRALQSLLDQTWVDFEIVVSDNASTDNTAEILRQVAQRDTRVRVHRQPRNIGAHANFGFVLADATAPYFMWAAADDWWAPEFVQRNLKFLEANPAYVSSVSQVRFEGDPERLRNRMGTFPLTGDVRDNLRHFLKRPQANSRFYAVHRTASLQRAWIEQGFWASDWAVVMNLLSFGKFHEIPEVLMFRSLRGASSDALRTIRSGSSNGPSLWLPMSKFSAYSLGHPEVRGSPRLLARLVYWNVRGSLEIVYQAVKNRLRRITDRSRS